MEKIQSFTVNHLTLLPGLYVSRVDEMDGFYFTTFDLRITRPNFEPVMDTPAIHTIEHLAATFFRNYHKDKTMYFGPMGCRTGFYLSIFGDREASDIKIAVENALNEILKATEVPAANDIQCGNYRDLSLFGAKEYAKEALEKGFSLNIYGE